MTHTTPTFQSYGGYSSQNYGAHALVFTDARGDDYYYSYKTLVAARLGGRLFVRRNVWGTTTGRHLNRIDPDHSTRVTAAQFDAVLAAYESLPASEFDKFVFNCRAIGAL